MARVFSWEDIRKGNVPTPEDFESMGKIIRHTLPKGNCIASAMFNGSFARGDSNRRSDIDCLVICTDKGEAHAMHMLSDMVHYAGGLNVPVEFALIREKDAKAGTHSIGPSYLEHFRLSDAWEGSRIVGRPALQLTPDPFTSPFEDALQYIERKRRGFRKRQISYRDMHQVNQLELLSKELSFAMHAARKMLHARGISFVRKDSRNPTVRKFSQVFEGDELRKVFKKLRMLDRQYTKLLERALQNPDLPKDVYDDGLSSIHEEANKLCLRFADLCLDELRS